MQYKNPFDAGSKYVRAWLQAIPKTRKFLCWNTQKKTGEKRMSGILVRSERGKSTIGSEH